MSFGSAFRKGGLGGMLPGSRSNGPVLAGGIGGAPWKLREGIVDIAPMVFPSTAAGLLTALGSPAGWTAANVLAIYLCDTASPLVDSLGLGPNLVAAGGPLVQRYGCGIPHGGTLWGKQACELLHATNNVFADAGTAFGNVPLGGQLSVLTVLRFSAPLDVPGGGRLFGKEYLYGGGVNPRWIVVCGGTTVQLYRCNNIGAGGFGTTINDARLPHGWHSIAMVFDDALKQEWMLTDMVDGGPNPYVGDLTSVLAHFNIGMGWSAAQGAQFAYVAVFDRALTSAMRAAFWEPMVRWSYPTDLFTTRTRSSRITVPIGYQPGVGQLVATYGAGQPAHAWAAGPKQSQSALLAGTTLPLDWRQSVTQNAPGVLDMAGMCYDSLRRQMVLFGGWNGVSRLNDTWIYDLVSQEWTQISRGGPVERRSMQLVYDAARDRVVLFGGQDPVGANGETWEWNPATRQWTQMAPVASPTARYDYAATYDSVRQRVLIFGGVDAGAVLRRETYEYDGITWTQVSNVGPSARRGAAMAYDAAQGLTLLFGGDDGAVNAESWSWNGATAAWANLAPVASPAARANHALWYDNVRQRPFTAFGSTGVVQGDTWSYDWTANTWTLATAAGATARQYTSLIFDTVQGIAVLFGGLTTAIVNDTWTYARGPVGLAAAARGTFLGIGSNNLAGWTNFGNAIAAVDGPSGMRDAVRVTEGAAGWFGAFTFSPTATLVGATNVPFAWGVQYKRATVGSTARMIIQTFGDPAGAENFAVITDGSTPTEWTQFLGSFIPVGAAHNQMQVYVGSNLNTENCDWAEPYAIQGTDQPAPYYLRTGTPAAETVAAQTTTLTGGKYAPPEKAHLLFQIHGAPGATERMGAVDETLWRSVPAAGLAGEVFVRLAPDIQVMLCDSTGYSLGILRTGYVPRAGESVDVDVVWDSSAALPVALPGPGGTDHIAIFLNGTFAVSGQAANWVAAAKASIATVRAFSGN